MNSTMIWLQYFISVVYAIGVIMEIEVFGFDVEETGAKVIGLFVGSLVVGDEEVGAEVTGLFVGALVAGDDEVGAEVVGSDVIGLFVGSIVVGDDVVGMVVGSAVTSKH